MKEKIFNNIPWKWNEFKRNEKKWNRYGAHMNIKYLSITAREASTIQIIIIICGLHSLVQLFCIRSSNKNESKFREKNRFSQIFPFTFLTVYWKFHISADYPTLPFDVGIRKKAQRQWRAIKQRLQWTFNADCYWIEFPSNFIYKSFTECHCV